MLKEEFEMNLFVLLHQGVSLANSVNVILGIYESVDNMGGE